MTHPDPDPGGRGPLPSEPLACRQRAEQLLTGPFPDAAAAVAWALLAAAGEIHALRTQLRAERRR